MPLGVRREIQETNTSAHFLHFTQTNILGAQQIPATAGVKQYGVSSSAIWSTAELLRKLLTGLSPARQAPQSKTSLASLAVALTWLSHPTSLDLITSFSSALSMASVRERGG